MDSELESSPPPDVSPPPDFSPPPEFSPLNQPFPPLEPSPPTESSPSARSSPSVQLFSGQMPGLNLELFSKGLLWIVDRLTSLTVTNCTRLVIMKYEDELDALSGGGGEDSPELRAMAACQAYKILYGQYAITPDHSSYKEAMQANWSKTCWLPTSCYLRPHGTLDVAIAIKIITQFQSRFGIRGCGHNVNPGFGSLCGSGILIDLAEMDFVDISHYRNTVSVGPGATWGKVYDTLEKYDLTVAGGRVGSVGVAGLILGGGMSHFPNHWGLACDNVKNFEVALADTSVVQANETQNPDLFKALKGGGANFGIITKIDLYTSPEFKIWYTENIYSPDDAEKVIKACVEVQKAMEFDDRIGYNLFLGADAVAVSLVYRGWTNPPPIFKVFDDITPVNTPVPPKNMTQASLARALDHGGNINCETGALTIKVDADFYMEVYRLLQEVERGTSGEHTFICAIQPIGSAAVHKGKERGGNSLNLSEENQAWLGIRAEWSDESDRETEQRKICRFMESVESKAKEHGVFLNFQSMNDASHRQSPLESYGSESLSALRQASIKFDPMGLFQRLQNSGFLLRNTNDE